MPKVPRNVKIGCKIPLSLFCKFERMALLSDMRPQDYLRLMIGEAVGQKEGSDLSKDLQEVCGECELMQNHQAGIKDTVIKGFTVEKDDKCECHKCDEEDEE
jgi:hypothetical protein